MPAGANWPSQISERNSLLFLQRTKSAVSFGLTIIAIGWYPEATSAKFVNDWMITGDLGTCDEHGYFWFHARVGDIISSSGYRIGPGEIEDVLINHLGVAMAAVIGVPDAVRNEAIKAFIVLSRGVRPSEEIKESIRAMIKTRLAKHEAPREIEIGEALPLSMNGKILRRELRKREVRRMSSELSESPG